MVARIVILLGFLAAVVSSASIPSSRGLIDEQIKKIILAEIQKIPEPLEVTNKSVTIPQNDYVEGEITIYSSTISGISAADIPSLNVNVLELKMDGEIVFENLSIDVLLHQNFTYQKLKYDNNVTVKIVLEQLKVDLSGQYVVLKGHLHDLYFKPTIGSANFQLSGILGDNILSAVVADALTNYLPSLINADTTIFTTISTYLENAINAYLDSKKVLTNKLDALFLNA